MASAMDPASSGDFSEMVEVIFQNIQYLVTVSSFRGEHFTLEIECKRDANRWKGDFTSKYIEDITSKTGNYKKYPVFLRMLMSALKQGSESVFVDLLTYADLEMLKARKEKASGSSLQRALPPNNKRYLILTYAAEFDRVHFPLPLQYEDQPDPAVLKATIVALRAELEEIRALGAQGCTNHGMGHELRQLRQDNEALRDQLAKAQMGLKSDSGLGPEVERLTAVAKEAEKELRLMRKEREALAERAENAEAELEKERASHRREMRRKATAMSELEAQLLDAKEIARETRTKIRMLTEELDMAKRRAKVATTRKVYGSSGSAPRRPVSSTGREAQQRRAPSPTVNSRGPSPGRSGPSSRAPSPRIPQSSNSRAPRPSAGSHRASAGSAGSAGSRPASAGRTGRFDPTAYVQQKKEEQRQKQLDRSRRTFSPGGSRHSSGRSTPTRDSSFDYGRPRSGSRSNSVERNGQRASDGGGANGRQRTPDLGRQEGAGRRPLSARGGEANQRSKEAAQNGIVSKVAGPRARERANSPGAALQDVRDRLTEYASYQHEANEATLGTEVYDGDSIHEEAELRREEVESAEPLQPKKSGMFDDATEEIANIDERLQALQNFLKAAKEKGGSGAGRSFR